MRILWQGFTHPTITGAYNDALVAHLNEVARDGTTIEFRGVEPPDRHLHRLTEWRCAIQAIRSALEAEREGFDCVVLGHFQDAGLWEMRGALDVPVLGLGEGSMLYACQLGFRFGLVTIHPAFRRWHEEQVAKYTLGERLAGVRAMETSVELFVRTFEGDDGAGDEIVAQFERETRVLAEAGAEVVIPAGGLPALLLARRGVRELGGALILDPNTVLVKLAEVAVDLHALNGTAASRHSTFAKAPPEALEEFSSVVARMNA